MKNEKFTHFLSASDIALVVYEIESLVADFEMIGVRRPQEVLASREDMIWKCPKRGDIVITLDAAVKDGNGAMVAVARDYNETRSLVAVKLEGPWSVEVAEAEAMLWAANFDV